MGRERENGEEGGKGDKIRRGGEGKERNGKGEKEEGAVCHPWW